NCPPANAEELIKSAFLPAMGKHDSLGFLKFNNTLNGKGEVYQQYYKGIKVETYTTRFNYTNDQVTSIAGTFFPNLNIDTTGMISKEEATKVVVANADYLPQFKDKIGPNYFLEADIPLIDPHNNTVYYRFWVNKLAKKPGQYFIDALKGTLMTYIPNDANYLTDCYKCNGNAVIALTCQDDCDADACSSFLNNVILTLPTLYSGCVPIFSDSCITQTEVYRMASVGAGSTDALIIADVDDFINVYDASNYYNTTIPGSPPPIPQEIKYCFQDTLSKRNAIASSLQYGAVLAHNYFLAKQIEYDAPVIIYSHVPDDPSGNPGNAAAWNAIKERFEMGDGDETTMNAPVSDDVVAHEYGHRILYKMFEIGTHVTHSANIHKYEAGAIHEAVSDIFSVLVRKHAFGTIDWTIGSQVVITPSGNLPRDLAHPENTLPPQALYYNDPTAYWDTAANKIYNHAGIIVKWFYLITNGGTGIKFPTDGITVQAIGLDAAENVLIRGLDTLRAKGTKVPTYQNFCEATTLAAHALYPPTASGECSPELQ
ncbi:MAG TPA: M4 family metallopeptidase, partial [Chitinophagales bacterium]|nr:M4 family metallopeptidase [Chitinophagales bacterium]